MPNRLTTFFKKRHQSEADKTLDMADKAVKYARSQILKCQTSLEVNQLSEDRKLSLTKAICGSNVPGNEGIGVRDLIKEASQLILEANCNPDERALQVLKKTNAITSKYSLGNCYELALQSLDYILESYPDMRAELYSIGNGDHAFLVLNRAYYSAAQLPETWGESAVVCDPWAKKAYFAREAYGSLKNYYRDTKEECNAIESFDPNQHFLMSDPYMTTDVLRLAKMFSTVQFTPRQISSAI